LFDAGGRPATHENVRPETLRDIRFKLMNSIIRTSLNSGEALDAALAKRMFEEHAGFKREAAQRGFHGRCSV
jgi:hypothetical protein